jgi:predicted membrane protein
MAQQGFSIRINGIIGFIFMVLIFAALFFIARSIFILLAWISPVLIVLALIINYKTILNYLKFILSLLQRNVLGGIVAILLSVFGFPILAGVLFGKSILDRKVRKLTEAYSAREKDEFVEFEEVIRPGQDKTLDLPPLEQKENPIKEENKYKDLF